MINTFDASSNHELSDAVVHNQPAHLQSDLMTRLDAILCNIVSLTYPWIAKFQDQSESMRRPNRSNTVRIYANVFRHESPHIP